MDIINRHPQPQLAEKEYSMTLVPTSQASDTQHNKQYMISLNIQRKKKEKNKINFYKNLKDVIFKVKKSTVLHITN